MKTSRKEDWIVVVGVILLAMIVAVVFLVRNASEGDEAKPTNKQIITQASLYEAADPTKSYLEAKRALKLDPENEQATHVLFRTFYEAEHKPFSKELGFFPRFSQAYAIEYTPYLVIELKKKQILVQMEKEEIEEFGELDTAKIREQWFRKRVWGKDASDEKVVSAKKRNQLMAQFSYWVDLEIQPETGEIRVPEGYKPIPGKYLHSDGEFQLVRKLQGGGIVAVSKKGRLIKWMTPKTLYLAYQRKMKLYEQYAIYFDSEATVVQFGVDSTISILTRYGEDPMLPIPSQLIAEKLSDRGANWLRPGDPEIQRHDKFVLLKPFWDDIMNHLYAPGGISKSPIYKFSPEGNSMVATFEAVKTGDFLNGFVWLPLSNDEIIGWIEYALARPFSTFPS